MTPQRKPAMVGDPMVADDPRQYRAGSATNSPLPHEMPNSQPPSGQPLVPPSNPGPITPNTTPTPTRHPWLPGR
jgi:hypothetical protein